MLNPFDKKKASDFTKSRAPQNKEEQEEWQAANKNWWESNPMRYDHRIESIDGAEYSAEFYDEIDRRFLASVNEGFPWKKIPFDQFVDFDALSSQDVLEIGVGCGTHAQIFARRSHSYTGIDLTSYAVNATLKRLKDKGLEGRIVEMDAERMSFPESSFGFVWSWGVIHHSADTRAILEEIHRVLKPDGKVVFMVYHQSWWNTFVRAGLYYGLIRGGLFKGHDVHQLVQLNTDGALARFYTKEELMKDLDELFNVSRIDYLGSKHQLIPFGFGPVKVFVSRLIPNVLGRWITNRPFFAYMQVVTCSVVK